MIPVMLLPYRDAVEITQPGGSSFIVPRCQIVTRTVANASPHHKQPRPTLTIYLDPKTLPTQPTVGAVVKILNANATPRTGTITSITMWEHPLVGGLTKIEVT